MSATISDLELDTDPAEQSVITAPKRSLRALFLAAALGIVGVVSVNAAASGGKPASSAVSAQVLADSYGAKVDLIGVAALGGMVQLRFTVTDTNKADAIFHDRDKMPRLLIESNGQILEPPAGMKHSMKMVNGGSYFIIYGNRGNQVKEGTKVSVMIGDIRVEHQVAKA